VPYLDLPFHNDYISLGLGDRRGSVTGRVSLRYQRTERAGVIDLWGLDGYLWYQPVTSGWDIRARATLDRSYDDLDQNDYRRPGWRFEARYRWPRLEARAAFEWFRLEDYRVAERNYAERLFSASLGRGF
jgi:hypothetical protein